MASLTCKCGAPKATQKSFRCNPCNAAYRRLYYKSHRDTVLSVNKRAKRKNAGKWDRKYRDAHKVKISEHFKKYYLLHKDEITSRNRLYWRKNSVRLLAQHKEWARHNKALCAFLSKAYWARKRNASINDLTRTQWNAIQKQFDFKCVYCGSKDSITQDHVIPLSKGGGHTASNVVPACRSCNSSKKDRTVEEFMRVRHG